MSPRMKLPKVLALIVFLLLFSYGARAQDNYEIQVYGSDTVDKGATMVEFHTNYTADGLPAQNGMYASDHAVHETLEVTHGFTNWFETGFYVVHEYSIRLWMAVGRRPYPAPVSSAGVVEVAGGLEPVTGDWVSATAVLGRHMDVGDTADYR